MSATNLALTKVSKPLLREFVHQTESVVVNLEGRSNKWANNFDSNTYKLLIRSGYSRNINKLAKNDDMTRVEGKQVLTKTRKAQREKKTFRKTSRVGIGYEYFTPLYFKIKKRLHDI